MSYNFIVLFSIMVAVNAGHLSGYADYAPTVAKTVEYAVPAIAKTVEYAAPVTKTIYQSSPVYATKAVYDHEPVQYDNYHAKNIAYPSLGHYGHGTVSHHGKIIASPHSYVKKYDTRIISEEPHYKYAVPALPTVVKTPVSYPNIVKSHNEPEYHHSYSHAAPVIKSHYEPEYHHSYAHAAPVIKSHYEPDYQHSYAHAAPVIKSHYEPEYHHSYSHAAPVIKSHYEPDYQHSYAHAAPIIKSHYEPENHHSYTHAAPIIKSHYEPEYHHSHAHAAPVIKTAAVSYSPASVVSHTSFKSSNAHYGW